MLKFLRNTSVFLSLLTSHIGFAYDFSAADQLFTRRGENVTVLKQAIDAYQASLKTALTNDEKLHATENLGMLYAYRAQLIPDAQMRERIPYFTACMAALELIKPSAKFPETVQYYYWHSVCLAYWAESNGLLSSLQRSQELYDNLLKGIKIEPTYEGGGFDRILGVILSKLPPINPFGPTGDMARALQHFRSSLASPAFSQAANPETSTGQYFFSTHCYFAEAMIVAGMRAEARALLTDALARIDNGDVSPDMLPETAVAKAKMQRLVRGL